MNVEGTESLEPVARRLWIRGQVQGVGFRPAIARWAAACGLAGRIRNTTSGVEVWVEGAIREVGRFLDELSDHLPANARVQSLRVEACRPSGMSELRIEAPPVDTSEDREACGEVRLETILPLDRVTCRTCLSELQDPANRRAGYALISCADCGPRYSLVQAMPFERHATVLNAFPLCAACRAEFQNPGDRRYHAQTIACASCGPNVWLEDHQQRRIADRRDIFATTAALLRQGLILGVKGVGGYQLLADATSDVAVGRLRRLKQRPAKPLAVMVADVASASRLGLVDEEESVALTSEAGPIVILRARTPSPLSAQVSNGLGTVGIMLPTTGLHAMLVHAAGVPLVCTSANREGEPIAFESRQMHSNLGPGVAAWLEHNRDIRRPVDDSVVRVIGGRASTIRLGRGLGPLSLELPQRLLNCEPQIALGAQQKGAFAIWNGRQASLLPHVGDLDSIATQERYVSQLRDATELLLGSSVEPGGLSEGQADSRSQLSRVRDLHPDYFTSQWVRHHGQQATTVQHHHAHIAASSIELGWLEHPVLGVAMDGTGLGEDGTVWGGEWLVVNQGQCERVAHVRPFALVGGDLSVRQPWRCAVALLLEACGPRQASRWPWKAADGDSLLQCLRRRVGCVATSSVGRLFDGVAALVLGLEHVEFEGQAAMMLESISDRDTSTSYPFAWRNLPTRQLDWRPMIMQLVKDLECGTPAEILAMRFHRGLAGAIASECQRHGHLPVVLSGGVFQNRLLIELLRERFASGDQRVAYPGQIPVNDGAIAAGQLAVALQRQAVLAGSRRTA